LADGDLAAANREAPVSLGADFISEDARRTWRYRAAQVRDDPSAAAWITRAVIDAESGLAVGRAGFHGPPDEAGRAEVGYAVDPAFRRRGYARAALQVLLDWARSDPSIAVVRASVSPSNVASRALVAQFGFKEVGEQWDAEDGLELIFERVARQG